MPEVKKIGEARIPYGEGGDMGKDGDRRDVTRGISMGLTHHVVGQMAHKELGRGQSVRDGFPDSDLDSE